jgi:hypothetical protein
VIALGYPRRVTFLRRLGGRLATIGRLFAHFVRRRKWFFVPLLVVLLLAGLLLVATGGLAYVAPFVYAIF